jgi:phage terminase large subunit
MVPSFPKKFKPFFEPHRYKVGRGGRASAKSHSVASILVLLGSKKVLRVCCGREYQKSIDESVKQLLEDKIVAHGLQDFYEVQKNAIYGKNGTVFKFVGVKTNPTSLKSFEGIDIFWMEEAEKVSKRSWSIVIPTVRKEGSEIWITYNPDEEDDPTHKMVNELLAEKQDIVVCEMNWSDNAWFPQTLGRDLLR